MDCYRAVVNHDGRTATTDVDGISRKSFVTRGKKKITENPEVERIGEEAIGTSDVAAGAVVIPRDGDAAVS